MSAPELRQAASRRFATASALFFVLHESQHGVDGYAMYRIKKDWKRIFAFEK